jgi:archaellum component FlaC
MAETDNVIVARLLHIREAIDGVRNDIREMMQPIGKLECHYANMSDRLDRMDVRIERIEHRLDLTDA